mgnify:CR=1 FL=1
MDNMKMRNFGGEGPAVKEDSGGSLRSKYGSRAASTEGEQEEQVVPPVPAQLPFGTASSFTQNNNDSHVLDSSGFTLVDVQEGVMQFASEWRPTMETPNYIGETTMLLEYLKRQERLHQVTMPIRACGVDPIVFENVGYLDMGDNAPQAKLFYIGSASTVLSDDEDTTQVNATPPAYELIEVDGELYLSCVSECLNREYLNSVIAEATSSVKATGSYVFQMVGYKKLALENGKNEGRLLNTLKLNSYEMSVLCTYMRKFEGIEVTHLVTSGKQCISFVLSHH